MYNHIRNKKQSILLLNSYKYRHYTDSDIARLFGMSRQSVKRYRTNRSTQEERQSLLARLPEEPITIEPSNGVFVNSRFVDQLLITERVVTQDVSSEQEMPLCAAPVEEEALDLGTTMEIALRGSCALYNVLDIIQTRGIQPVDYIYVEGVCKPRFSYKEVMNEDGYTHSELCEVRVRQG